MSINRVNITGNLTRDPELRMTQQGMAILTFGVAVNDRRKNQQTGEWEDYANFVDCTMFGNRAQSVSNYISKGSKVAIEGKLRWSQWETNEGQKRSKLEVVVDEIEFMSQRPQNAAQGAQQPQAGGYSVQPQNAPQAAVQPPQYGYGQQPPQYGYGQQAPNTAVYDSDIPF